VVVKSEQVILETYGIA